MDKFSAQKGELDGEIRSINTQEQEKLRVSCLLTVFASGEKLPPFIVFKGEKDGGLLKELSNNPHVLNKDIFIGLN